MKLTEITARFKNMRILKFHQPSSGPLRKQNFNGFERSSFVIGGFQPVLCVSVFQGSLLVIVIMIDGSKKCNCEGSVCMFVKRVITNSS